MEANPDETGSTGDYLIELARACERDRLMRGEVVGPTATIAHMLGRDSILTT